MCVKKVSQTEPVKVKMMASEILSLPTPGAYDFVSRRPYCVSKYARTMACAERPGTVEEDAVLCCAVQASVGSARRRVWTVDCGLWRRTSLELAHDRKRHGREHRLHALGDGASFLL